MLPAGKRAKGAEYHSKADVGHDPFVFVPPRRHRSDGVDPALRAVVWLAIAVANIAALRGVWVLVRNYF